VGCSCGVLGDDFKAGPLAEYERRIAAGELKSGDEFQVLGMSFLDMQTYDSC